MVKLHRGERSLALIRRQHWLFFPILLFARFNWAWAGIQHAWRLAFRSPRGRVELGLIGLHYLGCFGLAFIMLPPLVALWYIALAQIFSGAFLAIVFVQSHSGMEVYSAPQDFVTAQVISSRDLQANVWNIWFTGGLNFQIEHHLFPTLPRHNLGRVCSEVRTLCKKHGLNYDTRSMAQSTKIVIRCLRDVAMQA